MFKYILIAMILLFSSCTKLITNTSKPFVDVQDGLLQNTKSLNEVAKKVDTLGDLQKKIAVNLGLETSEYDKQKTVSNDTKELLAQIKSDHEDAKKDREANAEMIKILMATLKTLAPAAGALVGVPPNVTSAGLTAVDALMGVGGVGAVAKIGLDMYARRRREDEHEKELADSEAEKEGIRLRLEREKEELRVKGLIKQETMAMINPESQQEFILAKEKAIKNLKARGEI